MAGSDAAAFELFVEPLAAGIRLRPVGDIDYAVTAHLDTAYEAVVAAPPSDVIVDLRGTTYLSSVGMGFLVRLHKHTSQTGHRVVVYGAPPRIARKLALSGLDGILATAEVYRERED
jgi:anti-anti-sigma factor